MCIFKKEYKNSFQSITEADVLIYSPTILSGLLFDVPNHFHKIFGIKYPDVATQRDFFQMLARVRKLNNNVISILIVNLYKKNEYFFDRP